MKTLIMFALIIAASTAFGDIVSRKPLTIADVMAAAKPEDWREVDPQNLLYMEIPAGKVVIELNPNFAPHHVANVKALAKAHYWDGLDVVRAQDNYVVQWADPEADKPEKKRKIPVALETADGELDRSYDSKIPFYVLPDKDTYAAETGFSDGFPAGRNKKEKKMWLLHCYGAVGVGRDVAVNSGDGTELYAVIGHAPRHLDRNVTVIGRVIDGMDLLSTLPRGHGNLGFYDTAKNDKNVPIKSVKLASEVAISERVNYEVLRTDTDLFKKLVDARRNRREEWFHYSAGRIDACNFPIPARSRGSSKP